VNHSRGTAITDVNGNASASFVSGTGSSSIGTYHLTTTVTSDGLTGVANATFAVQYAATATLTVNKVMVNENGGTKQASDFSFSVNGGTPVAFQNDGSNVLSVAAGTYNVTEPSPLGYTPTYSNCSNIVLGVGGSATCTITNSDHSSTQTPELSATAGSSKPTYVRGETVTMTARVLRNGVPVAGALVAFDALKPNLLNHVRGSATTDGNGNASVSFVSGTGSSSIGTYQLTATASSNGQTTQAFATFVVQ
jgi:hypothetical protein